MLEGWHLQIRTNKYLSIIIEVPDVEPGPFRVMLNFIYWHGHDLDELNQYNAEALLFAGGRKHFTVFSLK